MLVFMIVILVLVAFLTNSFILYHVMGAQFNIVTYGVKVVDVASSYNVSYRVLYANLALTNNSRLTLLVGDCQSNMEVLEGPRVELGVSGVIEVPEGRRLCQVMLRFKGVDLIWDEAINVGPGVVVYSWNLGEPSSQVTVEVEFNIRSVRVEGLHSGLVKITWFNRGDPVGYSIVDCTTQCNANLRPPSKVTSYNIDIQTNPSLEEIVATSLATTMTPVMVTLISIWLYRRFKKR